MGGFDAVGDIGAQQDAEDGKDGHDGEDDLVAVDTLMAIEDGAVDGVHEGAGQIADEGGHGHGRACDFAGGRRLHPWGRRRRRACCRRRH